MLFYSFIMLKTFTVLLLSLSFSLTAQPRNTNPVILISIDGFAGYYLTKYQLPYLSSLAKQGTYTQALLPVYPSKTFPNHLTMVTGKSPSEHGIVHNSFYHRKLNKRYTLGAGKNNSDWLTAQPIWTIAEQQGIKTAVYFWPESETKINNILPTYFKPYKHNTPNHVRLDKIISWLQLPKHQRPQLLISYLSVIDDVGHKYGTNSLKTKTALQELDRLIENFVNKIQRDTNLTPNIILVSDHGMVDVNLGQKLLPESLFTVDLQTIVVNGQTQLYLYNDDENSINAIYAQLTKHEMHSHFRAYLAKDFPAHWQFNDNTATLPDLIVEAIPPAIFTRKNKKDPFATHGYDPLGVDALNAILIASGPDIAKEKKLKQLENRHVFHLLTSLLSLETTSKNKHILPLLNNQH